MNSTPRWLHLKTEAETVDKQYSSAAATDTPVGAAAGDTLQIPALFAAQVHKASLDHGYTCTKHKVGRQCLQARSHMMVLALCMSVGGIQSIAPNPA